MSEFLGLSPTICDYPSRPYDYPSPYYHNHATIPRLTITTMRLSLALLSQPCDYGDTSIYPTDDLPMTTLPRSGCTPDDGLEFYADLGKGGRMIIFS